jgi:hypothetical protein
VKEEVHQMQPSTPIWSLIPVSECITKYPAYQTWSTGYPEELTYWKGKKLKADSIVYAKWRTFICLKTSGAPEGASRRLAHFPARHERHFRRMQVSRRFDQP